MKKYKYIIIGGGTTSGYAAMEFARRGLKKGELCIISTESILPMDRPPLSKDYLKGDMQTAEEIEINENNFYFDHGIEVLLETRVKLVDFDNKMLELDKNGPISYEKLLIATGSTLNHLDIEGADLDNVFYLRSIEHADKIRHAAGNSRQAAVLGGQFIGTETAAGLNSLGLDVTMIFPEARMLALYSNDVITGFFESFFKEKGIRIIKEKRVTKLRGDSKVSNVLLDTGETMETDMVIAGIGVRPDVALFKDAPVETDRGVLVNEFCETNIPDVYAAGDVAEFPDLIFGGRRRVEHWENAMEQGKHAARVMTGDRKPYVFVPYFFSDLFDLSYEYFGDHSQADDIIYRGNTKKGDFSAWWLKEGKLNAAFIMGSRPDEEREKARQWIRERIKVDIH